MTPQNEINQRLIKLREKLAEAGLDGALFHYAVDVFYFTGTRQNSVLWIPLDGDPVLLVRKSFSRAAQESVVRDVRPFPSSRDLPAVFGSSVKTIGITFDVLPIQHFNFYRGLLGNCEFLDISAINRDLRSVKSDWELQQMRISGQMLANAFSTIPEFLRPGMREIDLAAEFEYRLRKLGIGGYLRIRGFNQEITGIAVSGENAAVSGCFDGPVTGRGLWTAAPYGPSADPVRENVPILVDYGGFYNGYIVDMTRVFCIGKLDPDLEQAFRIALAIQSWVKDNLTPGAICEDLFYRAAKMAADAGLAEHFMGHPGELAKFVGHGVGLELDELPVLAPKFRTPLLLGQTIAVEPKFLFPDRGAIGIENTFAVTEQGSEKLTDLSDDIVYL
ncbi:MAG: aminopeptidase P family protein [Nitrospirae bacterium]|nr:aminopeptidase P family protein [Nitrospirota bacterium]